MLNRSPVVALALVAACKISDATFTKASEDAQTSDAPTSDALSVDAAPQPQFPSCVGLAATCGASGNDSCCNSLAVPGGSYNRSYDIAGDGAFGNMMYAATVSNFRLDKYEVTVERFRAFVNAGMGTQLSPPLPGSGGHTQIAGSSGWDASWNTSLVANTAALVAVVKCNSVFQTWTDTPAANEHRPMNCITWFEAMAFCAWDGGFLPTEAEWNYAAAGGDQQRAYPWSMPAGSLTPLDSSHASYYVGPNCVGDGTAGCAVTDLVAVGTKPAGDGRWGQSDLAGNVWEWTLDWATSYVSPCTDCAALAAASNRRVRGGSYNYGVLSLRTGYRGTGGPANRLDNIGVRCARAP
jgi:formylglycine-generating enzyme required for sulfatase activity